MTDFFADLEREIRAAHPRRPRPAVPVRGIAATAAVATTLVALVFALGALTGATEGEVAQQPPVEEGWTEYAPLEGECQVRWVDAPAPEGLRSRFAVLREDGDAGGWDRGVDARVAVVYTEGVREVAQGGRRFSVIPVAFASGGDCEDLAPGVCLYGNGGRSRCVRAGRRPMVAPVVIADQPGRRHVFVLAEDAVREIRMQTYARRGGRVGWTVDIAMPDNLTSESLPLARGERVRVSLVE